MIPAKYFYPIIIVMLCSVVIWLCVKPVMTHDEIIADNVRRQERITADSLKIADLERIGTVRYKRIEELTMQLDSLLKDTLRIRKKYVPIRAAVRELDADGSIDFLSKRVSH